MQNCEPGTVSMYVVKNRGSAGEGIESAVGIAVHDLWLLMV